MFSSSRAEPVRRAPTAAELAVLKEPIQLGERVYDALARFFHDQSRRRYAGGIGVYTSWPTVEVLHAIGYISDYDLRLAHQYRLRLPVATFKRTDPVLWIQTKAGEISFNWDREISLRR